MSNVTSARRAREERTIGRAIDFLHEIQTLVLELYRLDGKLDSADWRLVDALLCKAGGGRPAATAGRLASALMRPETDFFGDGEDEEAEAATPEYEDCPACHERMFGEEVAKWMVDSVSGGRRCRPCEEGGRWACAHCGVARGGLHKGTCPHPLDVLSSHCVRKR